MIRLALALTALVWTLAPADAGAIPPPLKKIVLVAGRPSHGYGAHEHNAGLVLLKKRLEASGMPVKVELHKSGWPKDAKAFDGADAIVLYMDGGGRHPALQHLDQLDALMKKGVGLMCMHYAVEIPKGDGGEAWRKWIGGYYETHFSVNPHWDAKVTLKKGHAITNGVEPFEVRDEWYFNMRFREGKEGVVDILQAVPDDEARSGKTTHPRGPKKHIVEASGRSETLMWAVERKDGGRGVGFTGGHFHWNWGHPGQMRLALNAIVWISGLDVPKEGVKFAPPTLEELEHDQDEKIDAKRYKRDKVKSDLEAWQAKKAAASTTKRTTATTAAAGAKKKIVIIAGRDSHGSNAHNWGEGSDLLAMALREESGMDLDVVVSKKWPTDASVFDDADTVVILSDGGGRHPVMPHLKTFDKIMDRGVGLVCVHYAVEVPKGDAGKAMLKWMGGYFETHWSVNPHWEAEFELIPGHPVANGVKPFKLNDEWYYHMRFQPEGVTPILSALPPKETLKRKDGPHSGNPHVRKHVLEDKAKQHVAWAYQRPDDKGRGFGITGAHYHKAWDHDDFRKVVLNAIVWTAGLDVPKDGVKSKANPTERLREKAKAGKPSAAKPASVPGALFASAVVTSKTPGHAVDVKASIKGVRNLYLVMTDGGDGYSCDWADWAEPRLVDAEGNETKLTDMKWKTATSEWGKVRINANANGQPLRVAGKPVAYGIGAHANSVVHFELPAGHKFVKFVARGGLDNGGTDQQGGGVTSVAFMVFDQPPAFAKIQHAATVTEGATHVPLDYFTVAEGYEVTLWAKSPLLMNPTNMDIDARGRIWVAEGMNYRGSRKRPEGDRIVVLEDTDGDGAADSSHTFVQDKELVSPLGVAVIGNKVIVSQPPHLIVYTDVDGDAKFDPAIDKRENLLTGFNGKNHDHSLHSVTVHPNGRYLFNCGNMGAQVTDKSGRTFNLGSPYSMKQVAGKPSADGHVYIGGASFTVNPDGTGLRVIGHNYRNSYEQTVTSFGDVFMNDNDDPPACRTSWVMEYANFGFASADGKRSWQADKRFGQSTPIAEWRQDDPGITPAGDVYGGGAPTGIVYYENGVLGDKAGGLLLSCESARAVVFGYRPVPDGAGFKLERFDFLTTNIEKEFAGADFRGGRTSTKTLFRPSDVAVGPDGAIYVADWYDARVGGHSTKDKGATGSIYRVAPRGFKPHVPKLELDTIDGQIAALRNPAPNVRALGFYKLREAGAKAVPAVAKLLDDDNPYIAARAIFLLAQLGDSGRAEIVKLIEHHDPQVQIAVFRALRSVDAMTGESMALLSNDKSVAVRREVALAMRDVPWKDSKTALVNIATQYDGIDRWYLEALGTGATGKEAMLYQSLRAKQHKDPTRWSPAFAMIAWRLHPVIAVDDLKTRAMSSTLTLEERDRAIDTLAFIPDQAAAEAMLAIANEGPADTFRRAAYWVRHRDTHDWRPYQLAGKLPKQPAPKPPVVIKIDPNAPKNALPPVAEIIKLKGNAESGKKLFAGNAVCLGCHAVAGNGGQIGPDLTTVAQKLNTAGLINSMVDPSESIALGFDAEIITKKDGNIVMGRVVGEGDPVLIKDQLFQQHAIDLKDIAKREKMTTSLMPPAASIGLKAQDLADLAAYLRSIR